MKQLLPDDWSLELDPSFSRSETEDGFTVFTKPGMDIWAVVYCNQSFDSEAAVQSFVDRQLREATEIQFRSDPGEIVSRSFLIDEDEDGWQLQAFAASLGRVVILEYQFQEESAADAAIAVWHTLQHDPPSWVKMCGLAEPPLALLREALDSGRRINCAIDEVLERNQNSEAKAVLFKAMNSECATVRQSACEAFEFLDDSSDEVLSALRRRLRDEIVEVRAWAADTLLYLSEPEKTVVPAMIEGLQKHEEPMPQGEDRIQGVCRYHSVPDRYHAARILSSVGEAARPARDVLLKHQYDESGYVRLRVAEALSNIGEPKDVIVSAMRDALSNPIFSERERLEFIEPLLEYGESLETLLPVVRRALDQTTDRAAIDEAHRILERFGN